MEFSLGERTKQNMEKLSIPVGTDNPTLLALGATPLDEQGKKPIKISFSQAGTWQHCQKMWEYGYLEQWTPKKEKSYFVSGRLVHEWLAIYYQLMQQKAPNDEAMKMVNEYILETHLDPENIENFDVEFMTRLVRVVNRYMDRAPVWDKGRRFLGVEQEGFLPLVTDQGRDILFHFIVDLIYETEGIIGIEDHKTMGGARWWSRDKVLMSPQLGSYSAAVAILGVELPSGRVTHIVDELSVNQINTYNYKTDFWQKPDNDLFRRATTRRTKTEMRYMMQHFMDIVDEIQDKIEKGKPFIRNLGPHCDTCDYKNVCLFDMKGVDVSDILSAGFKRKEDRDDPKSAEARSSDSIFGAF